MSLLLDFIPRQEASIIESSNQQERAKHLLRQQSSCSGASHCHLADVHARAAYTTSTGFLALTCKMGLPTLSAL